MGFRGFIRATFPTIEWKAPVVPCEVPHTYDIFPIPENARQDWERLVNYVQQDEQMIRDELKCITKGHNNIISLLLYDLVQFCN